MKLLSSRVRWSLRLYGLTGTSLQLLRVAKRRLLGHEADLAYCMQRDHFFDRHAGVDTAGRIDVDRLDVSPEFKTEIREYQPTSAVEAAMAIDLLPINPADYHFVDIGCGKGRILVIAGLHCFRGVTGVELSPALVETAKQNARNCRLRRRSGPIDVACCEASRFRFPNESLVVYLYNPFGELLVRELADVLEASLREQPRDCWIVYANAQHRGVFDANEFWSAQSTDDDDWWAVYRANRTLKSVGADAAGIASKFDRERATAIGAREAVSSAS